MPPHFNALSYPPPAETARVPLMSRHDILYAAGASLVALAATRPASEVAAEHLRREDTASNAAATVALRRAQRDLHNQGRQ